MRAEILEKLEAMRKPGIHLVESPNPSRSWLGGLPAISGPFDWPEYWGKPMSFLAQFDLSDIPKIDTPLVLPRSGILYFFFHQDPWMAEFDVEDPECWKVIYSAEGTALVERPFPPVDRSKARTSKWPNDHEYDPTPGADGIPFTRIDLEYRLINCYQDLSDSVTKLGIEAYKEVHEYLSLSMSVYDDRPVHQLFGHPIEAQNTEMPLESQLRFNGIDASPHDARGDPAMAEHLREGEKWHLLFQMESDKDFMFSDGGLLYFWIREQDAAELRFENVWMILDSP